MIFQDAFDRIDSNTLGNGWLPFHSGVFGMTIFDKKVLNEAAEKAAAIQFLSKPTKSSVQVRAAVVFSAEAADQRILIGTFANATAAGSPSPADLLWGFGCSLLFTVGGRTLTIWQDQYPAVPGLTSPEHKKTVDVAALTMRGGPDPLLPDLQVQQELRVIVTQEVDGTRVRAYLNNGDDSEPDLEYLSHRDMTAAVDGSWFHFLMGFGAAASQTLGVLSFEGADYDYRQADLVRSDTLTLKDVIDQAKLRYEGSSSQTNFDDVLAKQFANDAQEEILNELGDLAVFLRPRELMSLSVADDFTFELPRYVERVISILHPHSMDNVYGGVHAYGSRGQLIGIMPGLYSGDYWVSFEVRKERMATDDDLSVIPRRFAETLVLGTAYRMAVWDSAAKNGAILKAEFREKLLQTKHSLNVLNRGTKPRLRSVRPTRVYNTYPYSPWGN